MALLNRLKKLPHNLFYLTILLGAIIQLCAVAYFMPPWYDETIFASISYSFAHTGKFNLTVQPLLSPNGEFLFYGPVYFLLQSLLIKAGFFSAFSFRLLNFIGYWISVSLLYRLLTFLGVEKKKGIWFTLIMATNLIVVTNASSGRMDMLAFCFFCAALLYWRLFFVQQIPGYLQMIAGCIFVALAFLTTPRIVFVFLLPAVCMAQMFIKCIINKKWHKAFQICTLPLLIFSLLYLIWIRPKFGSFSAYLLLFNQNSNKIVQASFIDNLSYIQTAYLIFGAFYLFYAFKHVRSELKTFMIAILLTAIVFTIIVAPLSFYHCIIVPFLLVLMCLCWQSATKPVLGILLKAIIIYQATVLSAKYVIILTDINARNPTAIQTELAKRIPSGSRVLGNFNYYYAVVENGSAFECIEDLLPNEQPTPINVADKINQQLNDFNFNYLIVSRNHPIPPEYIGNTELTDSFFIPAKGGSLLKKLKWQLGIPYQHYYDGFIYKRKRTGIE